MPLFRRSDSAGSDEMKKANSQTFAAHEFNEALRHEMFLKAFKDFCLQEFNVENLLFWLDVEVFRTSETGKQAELAKRIYDTYLSKEGPLQINVAPSRKLAYPFTEITVDMFDALQDLVFANMRDDTLPRFAKSEAYNELQHKKNKDLKKYEASYIKDFATFFTTPAQ